MIAWDLDGNGTFETAGQTATFSAAGLDAPLTRTISVRATSPTGFSVDDATVRVIWDFHGSNRSLICRRSTMRRPAARSR